MENNITVQDKRKEFLAALEGYIDKVQAYSDNDFKENYPNVTPPRFKYMPGDKFARITREDGAQKSAFCFIDLSNGDIYKPASWSTRAKGVRGNIFNDNPPLTSGALYRYK